MDPSSLPVSKEQITALLRQFQAMGLVDRLQRREDPLDLTPVRQVVERLERAADPQSPETITMGEFHEAHMAVRTSLRAQLRQLRAADLPLPNE